MKINQNIMLIKNDKQHLIIPIIIMLLLGNFNLSAQFHDPKKGGGSPDKQLSQKDNDYLDRQAKVFLLSKGGRVSRQIPPLHTPARHPHCGPPPEEGGGGARGLSATLGLRPWAGCGIWGSTA